MKKLSIILILIFTSISLFNCTSIYHSVKKNLINSYKEGTILFRQRKYEEALEKFETVASIEPDYKRVKSYLKRTRRILSKKEKRIQRKSNIYYSKGVKLLKRRKYESALKMFLIVEEADPDYSDLDEKISFTREKLKPTYDKRIKQAKSRLKSGRYKKAYQSALSAKRIKPEGLDVFLVMNEIEDKLDEKSGKLRKDAEKLMTKGDYKLASKRLKKALKVNPWDDEAADLLKQCNFKLKIDKKYQAAVKSYRRKKYFVALNSFNYIKAKEPGFKKTDYYLERINAALKRNKRAYYNQGVRYYESGKFKAAIIQWNRVLLVEPGNKEALAYKKRAEAKLKIKESLQGK